MCEHLEDLLNKIRNISIVQFSDIWQYDRGIGLLNRKSHFLMKKPNDQYQYSGFNRTSPCSNFNIVTYNTSNIKEVALNEVINIYTLKLHTFVGITFWDNFDSWRFTGPEQFFYILLVRKVNKVKNPLNLGAL